MRDKLSQAEDGAELLGTGGGACPEVLPSERRKASVWEVE